MSKFEVYNLEEQAYKNVTDLRSRISTKNINGYEKEADRLRKKLDEILEYTPVEKTFNNWNELQNYLDNGEDENLLWREVGDLELREYCSKCGASAKTNSEGRLRHLKSMHDIQVCPEDKGR
jgi:protein subunit release factor A